MAGDWIKMRVDLADDPAVVAIALRLNIEEDSVVGKLHRLWSWADRHTSDGKTTGVNAAWVDRFVACKGFAEAMIASKWLEIDGDSLEFPKFHSHNGESAKKRADNALRQRLSRAERDKGVTGVTSRDVIPRPFVRAVMQRDNYQCVYCGTESSKELEESRRAKLAIDHLKPQARGGRTVMENLVTSCRRCNMEKSDRTPEEWDMLPEFLQDGLQYANGVVTTMSQEPCDKSVTREEKRREEIYKKPVSGFSKIEWWAKFSEPDLKDDSKIEALFGAAVAAGYAKDDDFEFRQFAALVFNVRRAKKTKSRFGLFTRIVEGRVRDKYSNSSDWRRRAIERDHDESRQALKRLDSVQPARQVSKATQESEAAQDHQERLEASRKALREAYPS
jgi:hypothetical protein